MREPSCLMRSFSYNHTTHIPNNHVRMMEENYAHGFKGCVTSVDFMSDSSGGCEKWSNVSKKCYVEEAKSYAQPGSVAEKKAFFDAFYKKIAAQKAAAAALLEQEKAAAAASAAAEAEQVTSKVVDLAIDNYIVDVDSKNVDLLNVKNLEGLKKERPLFKLKPNAVEEVRRPIIKKKPASSSWAASIHHRKDDTSTLRTKNFTSNDYTDKRRLAPKSLKVLMNTSFVKESCSTTQSTKFTSSVNSTPKRAVTPVKTQALTSSVGSTPKRAVTPVKTQALTSSVGSTPKRAVTPMKTVTRAVTPVKIQAPTSSVSFTPKRAVTPVKTPAPTSSVSSTPKRAVTPMTTVGKPAPTSSFKSTPKRAVTPMKTSSPTLSVNSTAKHAITPMKTSSPTLSVNSTAKRAITPMKTPAPTSSVNSTAKRAITPMKTSAPTSSVKSTPKCAVTPMKSPTPTSNVNSTPKRAVTPMKTAGKPFVNEVNKQPSVTLSVNTRIETDAHPTVVGSRSTGPKWYNLSAVSQSLTAYKSKLKSPTISSPFVSRTEDRAARRKQKLEEKFNEKQAQVVQRKAQFKEKAETEFRTMRESSYFKALPLPDFYKGRGTPEKILEAIRNRYH